MAPIQPKSENQFQIFFAKELNHPKKLFEPLFLNYSSNKGNKKEWLFSLNKNDKEDEKELLSKLLKKAHDFNLLPFQLQAVSQRTQVETLYLNLMKEAHYANDNLG